MKKAITGLLELIKRSLGLQKKFLFMRERTKKRRKRKRNGIVLATGRSILTTGRTEPCSDCRALWLLLSYVIFYAFNYD